MRELKKQIEILLINYFRYSFDDFPGGRLVPSESPDFILKTRNSRRIGIELVRLNPGSAPDATEEMTAQQALFDEVIDDAFDLFEKGSDLKLFAKFRFSEDHPVSDERSLAVSVKLAAAIRSGVEHKKGGSFYSLNLDAEKLPEGVDEALLVHHPDLEQSVWERCNKLGISGDVVGDIRVAIRKKEEKLHLYRRKKTGELWLLMVTDQLRSVKNYHLQNQIERESFSSEFDRVFLFDLVRKKVIELK